MARITELRIRPDWAFVRFVYLPAIAVALGATKLWPTAARFALCAAPCAVCALLSRWGQHIEEWYNRKPLFAITDGGLVLEDGGEAVEFAWSEITSVVIHRRNPIPLWRTNGSFDIAPPYWLAITLRDPYGYSKGYGYRHSYGSSYTDDEDADPEDDERTICVWPRQVQGGLWSLMRFAKELQLRLVDAAGRGEIPTLLPTPKRGSNEQALSLRSVG